MRPAGEPGGEARADRDRDREDREVGGDHLLGAAEPFFTSGGSSDSTTAPTSQNQLVTSAPHHSRGSLAQMADQQPPWRPTMLRIDLKVRARRRRCAG